MQRDYLIRVETEKHARFQKAQWFNDWFCY